MLAGTGDDKTNIVVYAGIFNQDALYSRDVNVSHDADFRLEGGEDLRSSNFAGLVGSQQFAPRFNTFAAGLRTPTPHAFANASNDPQYQNTSNVGLFPGQRPLPSEQLSLTSLTPRRKLPQLIVNTSTARSTATFATSI